MTDKNTLKGAVFLLVAAFIWGFAMVALKAGTENLQPFSFTGYRCLLGGISLIPLWLFVDKRKSPAQREVERNPKTLVIGSIVCGLNLMTFTIAQQLGLPFTTIGKAGFITALYIILVPLAGVFLGRKIEKTVWIAVVVAMTGFYFMCLYGGSAAFNRGDMMMLFAAVFYTVYFYMVDHFVQQLDPVKFSSCQFIVTGIVCSEISLLFEDTSLADVQAAIVPLLYGGICSCGLGYTFQVIGQRYMEPAKASLLLSSETVFTMIAGMIFFQEKLAFREYLGCGLIFCAIILSQMQRKS